MNGNINLIITTLLVLAGCARHESALQGKIEALIGDFPAEVGVSVFSPADTVAINAEGHFPMFSIVKFYQALAVSEQMRKDQVHLTTETGSCNVKVTDEDLKPDTWSPMREEHPEGGDFSVRQLIEYSLMNSDNNACDILFNRFVTPRQVEGCARNWGINGCGVAWTEDEQHIDPQRAYDNWTTPAAAVSLLKIFYEIHGMDDFSQFVWDTMSKCNTGTARIPKYISDKASMCWISLIRIPEFVTKEEFDWAVTEAAHKKGIDCSKAEFLTLEEGLCAQIMHIGHYDDEPATIAVLNDFINKSGYEAYIDLQQHFHHEIYLSDPRKTAQDKLKTVIRYSIKRQM